MREKIRVSLCVGLLYLMSPVVYAHADGVHAMPLLDGILHFLTQPSHLVWVILAALFVLLYRFGHSLPRRYNKLRIRKTPDE
jgi:hypothetical protein